MARKSRRAQPEPPTLKYEAVINTPGVDDDRLVFMFEKIREVAYPRIHVEFQLGSRRELEVALRDLNVELRSRNCPEIDVEDFSRGVAVA